MSPVGTALFARFADVPAELREPRAGAGRVFESMFPPPPAPPLAPALAGAISPPHVPQKTADFGHQESAESAPRGRFLARQCDLHTATLASQW